MSFRCNQQDKIVNRLILNSSNLNNLGLYHGKMGIVLYFYQYAIYSKENIYKIYAEELLEEIFNEIDISISIYMENGLCGIGWAIEYLVQNNFICGNTNEILIDIDNEIMKLNVSRISNFSIENGLGGIFLYILTRLTSPSRGRGALPFDDIFLDSLKNQIKFYKNTENRDPILEYILFDYCQYLSDPFVAREKFFLPYLLKKNIKKNITHNAIIPLGLVNGLAGMGLKRIIK